MHSEHRVGKMQQIMLDEDDGMQEVSEPVHHFTSARKLSRSDVYFPLTAPRRPRAPSIGCMSDLTGKEEEIKLTIRAKGVDTETMPQADADERQREQENPKSQTMPKLSIKDLPIEVRCKVLDYIFGEVHSVGATATSLRGKNVSSAMRHPRRKAVSDLALVSQDWCELVQERIYRHIKIKGTRGGLQESADYFSEHMHLTAHVRHVEFWVPVWGDRSSLDLMMPTNEFPTSHGGSRDTFREPNRYPYPAIGFSAPSSLNDPTAIFKQSINSATLAEIFDHIACFFPSTPIFTLEGGHCKNSNMIRHFRSNLLFQPSELHTLPAIRTFAMRGAWNIMRLDPHWQTIAKALPNIQEWHCGYAKPRPQAYDLINHIVGGLPSQLRHVNISLDGLYSKDSTTLSSTDVSHSPSVPHHLCERLGRIAPQLESLSFTGKICSCFWSVALAAPNLAESRLKSLEMVVKSCCRQRVTTVDQETNEIIVDELGGVMADGAGITNIHFIKAFERLVLSTVQALDRFPLLQHVRIRFIDLDSPCSLLNPYFQLHKGKLTGLWSEEILEQLERSRRGLEYEELSDGLLEGWRKEGLHSDVGVSPLYPKVKPKGIKTSSYRLLADARS